MKRFGKRVTSILAAIMMLFDLVVPSTSLAAGNGVDAVTTLRGAKGVAQPTHIYDYEDILGSGIEYGITANEFNHTGHLQTNFAVNKYIGDGASGNSVTPNLSYSGSDPQPGSMAVAEISGQMHMTVNSGKMLFYTPNSEKNKVIGNLNNNVIFVPMTKDNVSRYIVNPIISHGSAMSGLLAEFDSISVPTSGVIDLTSYAENATIFLDGDALLSKIGSNYGAITINRKKDQLVVLNFKETKSANIYRIDWQVNGANTNDKEDIAEHVVYNLPVATNVNLYDATGIFLIPSPRATTTIQVSSEGWIITGGKLNQDNAGSEWHMRTHKKKKVTSAIVDLKKTVDDQTPKDNEKFDLKRNILI